MHRHSLHLTAPRELRWTEEPLPSLGPDDILVATRTGAISLGTEIPHYRGDSRGSHPDTYPRMTGYENVSIVQACGTAVAHLRPGDRVVCTYGHRTHAIIHASRAVPVPNDLGDDLAILTILSGDVATGIARLGTPPASVLVTGAGTIGLLAVFVLKALGVAVVDVVEPEARRRDLALALGARRTLTPEEVGPSGENYDAGVECSSRAAACTLLQTQLRHGGRMVIVADGNLEPLVLDPLFHERELTICGTSDCPDYHAHARWYFAHVTPAAPTLAQLFDLRVAAAELPTTFAQLADGTARAIKVLVHYDTQGTS
jgi:alcohol dehydrogenase